MIHPQEYQYMRTQDMPPHPTLVWALGSFVIEGGMRALDLGCGAGRDTRALVRAGFAEVVAIDHYPTFDTYVSKHITATELQSITFIHGGYQDIYPEGPFHLINAQLTLTHNPPEIFRRVIETTRQRLVPGGLFVGSLFGDRHPYNRPGTSFTFLTRQEVEIVLDGMEFLRFDERDEEGPAPYAGEQWHWFDVVAKKPLPA